MKKLHLIIALFALSAISIHAARTTYRFTNASWASKVGTVIVDGKTDGFKCITAGTDYATGRTYQSGDETITETRGVHITTNTTGASAISVIDFEQVREISFAYCTNASKGEGSIFIKVGENEENEIKISKPEKGHGAKLREVSLGFSEFPSGKISFRVECSANAIYIDAITIKAQNASPNVSGLTNDRFTILTNINELQDGDSVIFGTTNGQNYVMGLYDEWNSRNNIYALNATYSTDRTVVNEVEGAVYTAYKTDENTFVFADEDGYFLVASGGNPNNGSNNYLTIWNDYTSTSYGNYGLWQVSIDMFGNATIMNLGNSASKYMQFNYNGGTPIFACYKEQNQTPIVIYRRERISSNNTPKIQASFINFGDIEADETINIYGGIGSKTIEINAANLTEDISASLIGQNDYLTFRLSTDKIDRDGNLLTISYELFKVEIPTTPVSITDTLVLKSADIEKHVPIVLRLHRLVTISEAQQVPEQTPVWLKEVVVTKKYNMHIFVKDETGYMLLFDSGNVYGKDLKNGHILTGVSGLFKNYYSNPQIALNTQFERKQGETVNPDIITSMPATEDIGRYIRLENIEFIDKNNIKIGSDILPIYNLFNLEYQLMGNGLYNVEGIVYFYEEIVLCPSNIEFVQLTNAENRIEEQLTISAGNIINDNLFHIELFDISGKLFYSGNEQLISLPKTKGLLILRVNDKFVEIIK